MDDKFKRSERNAYSNEKKLALGELVAKFKDEFIALKPSTGFIAKAVRHFYSDLDNASKKLASRCSVIMIWNVCETLLPHLRNQGELVLDVK